MMFHNMRSRDLNRTNPDRSLSDNSTTTLRMHVLTGCRCRGCLQLLNHSSLMNSDVLQSESRKGLKKQSNAPPLQKAPFAVG